MSVTEHDLEILEMWLDGELSEEQVVELRKRVSAEPELAQAHERLRSDRQLRTRMWQSLEPADAQVESLISRVRADIRKEEVWSSRFRSLSRVSGIAASIAVVFMMGWVGRDRLHFADPNRTVLVTKTTPANPTGPTMSGTAVVVAHTPSSVNTGTVIPVARNEGNLLVSVPRDPARPFSTVRPTYKVRVVDPFDRVKYEKTLDRYEDAQKFAEYIAQFRPSVDPAQPLNFGRPVNATEP